MICHYICYLASYTRCLSKYRYYENFFFTMRDCFLKIILYCKYLKRFYNNYLSITQPILEILKLNDGFLRILWVACQVLQ